MRNFSLRNIPMKNFLTAGAATLLVFFLLAVGLSINLFLKAETQAKDAYLLDKAVTEATTIAETLKSSNGNLTDTATLLRSQEIPTLTESSLILYYDALLEPTLESAASYKATITAQAEDRHNVYSIQISDMANEAMIYELNFKYVTGGDGQ